MNSMLLSGLFVLCAFYSNAQSSKKPLTSCDLGVTINRDYSKAAVLDSIMKHYTTNAMPGLSMAVYSDKEGWWASAQGYASVETKTLMQNCHLQYLQSISKTYMAVEILQLKEKGKIDLEAPITKYLPVIYRRYIKYAEKITVRMLLNHTSGIPEYNENAGFVLR